ncbi:MAG: FKBP-type peptidyl-prolyl cis-trans isomerase [Bifidobacteriaceae bacterium]|jgi:peptidylprolyl isomerase|nr:FKBP-type peptidyl-prolyl cis-trans isomerase [Bifidobacteriaceae bacterium]
MKFNIKGYIIALVCVGLFVVATLVTVFVGKVTNNEATSSSSVQTAASPNPADNTAKAEDIQVSFDNKGVPSVNIPAGYKAADKLYTRVLKEGNGEKVEVDDSLKVDYAGWITDGKEFDSSYKSGKSANFELSKLVKGWQEGLKDQKVGSTVLLVIPPDLGYGSKAQNDIPANSTLVFVIHIISVD